MCHFLSLILWIDEIYTPVYYFIGRKCGALETYTQLLESCIHKEITHTLSSRSSKYVLK